MTGEERPTFTNAPPPDVMYLKTVCARLDDTHPDTVRAEIRRGRLQAGRLGNRIVVTERQFQAYLALLEAEGGGDIAPRRGRRRAS